MPDADGKWTVAPAASDGVHVRTADATALDGNVDVARFERLQFELGHVSLWLSHHLSLNWAAKTAYLLLFEAAPVLLVLNHVALGGLWVRHLDGLKNRILRAQLQTEGLKVQSGVFSQGQKGSLEDLHNDKEKDVMGF